MQAIGTQYGATIICIECCSLSYSLVIGRLIIMQIKDTPLHSPSYHSATAFRLSPTLTEVVLFGGSPQWPIKYKFDADLPHMANTIVLQLDTSCIGL